MQSPERLFCPLFIALEALMRWSWSHAADRSSLARRMRGLYMAAALAALLCAGRTDAQADAPLIQGESGGWRQGRATFYGGPERFLQNFADRGPPPEYGFGDAIFGSCGYTQQVRQPTAALVTPLDRHYAALATPPLVAAGTPSRCASPLHLSDQA